MEHHRPNIRSLSFVKRRHRGSIIHHAIGTNIGPPINLGTAVIHLANGDATNLGLHIGHSKLIPLTMVVIARNITLDIHAFQEEVIGLPHHQSFKCHLTTLRRFLLLNGLGSHLFGRGIIEHRHQGNFIGVPAYNGRGFRNGSTLDVTEQGTIMIRRKRLRQTLRREEELCREVDTGFSRCIFFPVFNQSFIRGTSPHQSSNRTLIFVRDSSGIIAIGVCRTVMRMLRVLVTRPHQQRNIPRVCSQDIVHIV